MAPGERGREVEGERCRHGEKGEGGGCVLKRERKKGEEGLIKGVRREEEGGGRRKEGGGWQ